MFKKKIERENEKFDCGEIGHNYTVVAYCKLREADENSKLCGLSLLVECRRCYERRQIESIQGSYNKVHSLWLNSKISYDELTSLKSLIDDKWECYQKEEKIITTLTKGGFNDKRK